AVLLRLQSFAEEPVACPVRALFPVSEARSADYHGRAADELTVRDGEVTVDLPALGTAAVLFRR
ncbi:hypothetical protein ACFRLW_43495, partial [Streptomyces sp. NPDC056728]